MATIRTCRCHPGGRVPSFGSHPSFVARTNHMGFDDMPVLRSVIPLTVELAAEFRRGVRCRLPLETKALSTLNPSVARRPRKFPKFFCEFFLTRFVNDERLKLL